MKLLCDNLAARILSLFMLLIGKNSPSRFTICQFSQCTYLDVHSFDRVFQYESPYHMCHDVINPDRTCVIIVPVHLLD